MCHDGGACEACRMRALRGHPGSRWAHVLGSLFVVVAVPPAVSGCASHRSQGTVVGEYRLVGGPAPGVNHPEPATIWAYAGHVDLSQMSHAKVAAHINTDGSGHFTLSAPRAYQAR